MPRCIRPRTRSLLSMLIWISTLTVGCALSPGSDASGGESATSAASDAVDSAAEAPTAGTAEAVGVEPWALEVVGEYPHDPTAFTQGLLWHDGKLYESTGRYGESTLRQVDPRTGDVRRMQSLEPTVFGEGLALVDGLLVQLTWQAGRAFVWDLESFELVDEWGYNGQGWGLAWTGEELIRSDGSARLTFHDPSDFSWRRTLEVTLEGRPLSNLNELEMVDGALWANVWSDDRIVRIDLDTGRVDRVVDASGLLAPSIRRMVDVLNGIAHDPSTGHFWLTGKYWPRVFEVRFVPAADD